MQLMRLLHKTFTKKLPFVHKITLGNLMLAVSTLIRTNKLTLTALGRNLSNQNKPRSNIKKIDRLVGNKQLQNESHLFYRAMIRSLIHENSSPLLLIDWSCLCSTTNLYLLRASLSMKGRSIVVYEECHPKTNENHHQTHKAFLERLQTLLPASVKPVIVTDAGFRAPWFEEVLSLKWDFIGRLRNKNLVFLNKEWSLSHTLHEEANSKPKYLGCGLLTKRHEVPVQLVLYKGVSKNRHKLNQRGKKSRASKSRKYSKAHKEPWLLVTSLTASTDIAKRSVQIYRQRMRIEENFRDTKCSKYGFALKDSRSRSPQRMKVLLLIAAIATFACWLAAIRTREQGLASDFQAHSSKFESVLSSVFLGREALKRGLRLAQRQFASLMEQLFQMTQPEAGLDCTG